MQTDLIIQYESFIDERWTAIVRYDCAHGFFHRDVMLPSGDKEKKAIEVPDLKYAFSFARQDMEDKWEWYKEQYNKQYDSKNSFNNRGNRTGRRIPE